MEEYYDFELISYKILGNSLIHLVNWENIIRQILNDMDCQIFAGIISKKFHNTLSEIIVDLAKKIPKTKVVLSGGCFKTDSKPGKFSPYLEQMDELDEVIPDDS